MVRSRKRLRLLSRSAIALSYSRRAAKNNMRTKIMSCEVVGVDAVPVEVQVDVAPGAISYHVAGLSSRWVEEGPERLRTALEMLGEEMPQARIQVRLSTPAAPRKEGGRFDLPILLGMLGADSRLSLDALDGLLVLGELGRNGALRAVKGTLPAARLARERGWRGVLVPRANAHEAVVVDGIEVYCADHLSEILDALTQALPLSLGDPQQTVDCPPHIKMSDVPGQAKARAALEIAAAGAHNLLMVSAPDNPQARLAYLIPTILPVMSHDEFLETVNVFSAIGMFARRFSAERPFRMPHHTISPAALVGGGTGPQPGEISLAHNGVLFLKELQEFSRRAISSLLKPQQARTVTLSRKSGRVVMPAAFLLVATANPCPCGWLDSGARECTCSEGSIRRYWARVGRPLLDRFDLRVPVRTIERADSPPTPSERSEVVRARVASAWARQQTRLAPWGLRRNAEMSREALAATCALDRSGKAALAEFAGTGRERTERNIARILRVARTIADLRERDAVDAACVLEASTYRAFEASSPDWRSARLAPAQRMNGAARAVARQSGIGE